LGHCAASRLHEPNLLVDHVRRAAAEEQGAAGEQPRKGRCWTALLRFYDHEAREVLKRRMRPQRKC
jgi:hypothetical protein